MSETNRVETGGVGQQAGKRVFLLSSCVTRDIFEYDAGGRFVITQFFSRSSCASFSSGTPVTDPLVVGKVEKLESPFQKRVVYADLEKAGFPLLAADDYDYLVIDLVDERFDTFAFDDGTVMTYSLWLSNTGVDLSELKGRLVPRFSEEFYPLWEAGWQKFADRMRSLGKLEKVILNKVYWAKRTETGGDFLPMFSDAFIDGANGFMDRLYERIGRDLPSGNILELGRGEYVGDEAHKWGKAPFHFVESYYRNALSMLERLP